MLDSLRLLGLKPHQGFFEEWQKAMATGLMTGRPFSKHTCRHYASYVKWFLEEYDSVSYDNLKAALVSIPVDHFGKRQTIHRAVVSFGKYLIQEKVLDKSFAEKAKAIKPKRHKPPKRTSVKAADIPRLINACKNPLDRLIIILLASTGLRAAEACNVALEDIDFEDRKLKVRCGKWGKERKVGISDGLMLALEAYLKTRPGMIPSDVLLQNGSRKPLDRHGLYFRLEKLGQRVGIKVSPHALRRAFVTINVGNGVPLVYLQIACGHQEITTTRSYCQTSEDEVIEAMKTTFTNFS